MKSSASASTGAVTRCRVCGADFFSEPLLRFENMPKAAQFLPDAQSVRNELGVDLEICQCAGCGLAQLSNAAVPYYKEVVRAAAFSEEMKDFRLQQFAELAKRYALQGKKVLELGCGRGEYLSLLRQSGMDAYGVEYSEASVAHCRANGLQASRGFVDGSGSLLEHAPFDAFFILNYLEHLPDPNASLRGVARNLADGALGFVEVPNFDMILRKNLFSEFIGDHLCYFTRDTLASTLNLNGFELLECREIWHDYILCAVVRKRARLDLSHFQCCQERLRSEIEGYLARFSPGKVAIWGAGHQALAVIALLNLAGKIRYVVDSAPFKQGRYTPATHVPIVPPDRLDSDPVDAVIVMAASYSDEVARIVNQRYGGAMNCVILREHGLEYVQC